MPSEIQTEHRTKLTRNQELYDPCLKEHNQSLECLWEHQDDKKKCSPFFENYTECVKFWNALQRERRRKGIEPALPPPEDRNKIKNDFLARKFHKQ